MKTKLFFTALIISLSTGIVLTSCEEFFDSELTEAEVIEGLKEALVVGASNSVVKANATDGYYAHDFIKIPFPPEAETAKQVMIDYLGLEETVNDFIRELNRSAEHAAIQAKPIFVNAITEITFEDAWDILYGEDNAASNYLHLKTFDNLFTAFSPDISNSLETIGASQTWETLANAYNQYAIYSPIHETINTDLGEYATGKALDGLFFLIEEEELKIRTDASARISEILQRVFGEQDDDF
ncbi:MAG: DUF4197 domain-containing protein [Bacteroidota bacterium]